MHLTNNAVQKNCAGYGRFEDGNQLSFKDLQRHIDESFEEGKRVSVQGELVEDMKYLVVKTMESVRTKLNPDLRKGCFEIFGFDFMLDADLTVWLIEANTNPCIEESSQLLRVLLPRMLDDAFKLTLDRQFPVSKKADGSIKTLIGTMGGSLRDYSAMRRESSKTGGIPSSTDDSRHTRMA